MTPDQYRFFDESVIEKQRLASENKSLNSAIIAIREAHVADSTANVKLESVIALHGEKEAIQNQTINLLQDDVDKFKIKTVRNRRIAIAGFGSVTLEAIIIAGFIYFR